MERQVNPKLGGVRCGSLPFNQYYCIYFYCSPRKYFGTSSETVPSASESFVIFKKILFGILPLSTS